MKFKDYLNSLVSRRKSSTSSTKSHQKPVIAKTQHDSTASTDCHYDICGYEDVRQPTADEQHSRTQVLLARHAELVNTIVGARSPNENSTSPSCTQCRMSVHHAVPFIPPPPSSIPPPLPPKLTLEQQIAFSNRNYSSTLATCSPRRECQLTHHHQHPQQPQQIFYPSSLICSQYSAPNSNVMSSSSNSLWATGSLSTKQRSRIRTNPWIGTNSPANRSSIFADSSNTYHQQTLPPNQPEYGIYDPTYRASPSGIIHSESFPQVISNGNIHSINIPPPPPAIPAPTSSVILHQSDSGHGFSLSSSRVINSSLSSTSSSAASSPSSSNTSSRHTTSGDGLRSDDKQYYRPKKLKKKISSISPPSVSKRNPKYNRHNEPYLYPNTIASDSGSLTRRKKAQQSSPPVTLQYRYQRPMNSGKTSNSMKPSNDRIQSKTYQSHSSSSRSIDDHFSLEFEEILENQHSYKQNKERKSTSPGKSPFILPLEETNMKLSSPPPILFSPTLTKTNSRAILKHIEEIENEIRMIKNLDLANNHHDDNGEEEENNDDDEDYVLSPHACLEEDFELEDDHIETNELSNEENKDGRHSIYEQVDQWVEKCLNTTTTTTNTSNSSSLLHSECDRLSNTIKDYVGFVCSNDEQPLTTQPMEIMTAFYISSTPTQIIRRTSSLHDKLIQSENTSTTSQQKTIHECPF